MTQTRLPTFFFSYARRNPGDAASPKLRQFFEDLQQTIEERTPGLLPEIRLGTYDQRVRQGTDWDDKLSAALKTNKALVAVATPAYFESSNCGKEIAVIARRHRNARIDSEGRLRHITNILHVRWLDDSAYESNGEQNAHIHPLLRKVTWTPEEDDKSGRIAAVQRYREKGMAMCVKPQRDYYTELLRAFADAIRNMPDLPPASFDIAWERIKSAFDANWTEIPLDSAVEQQHPTTVAESLPSAIPTGPSNVAVFYVTRSNLPFEARSVSFADRLINEPALRRSLAPGSVNSIMTLVQGIQRATSAERLNDFHCACNPQIPVEPTRLLHQLGELSARNVVVAVSVDSSIWFGDTPGELATRNALDQVVRSDQWHGPILLTAAIGDAALDISSRLKKLRFRRALVSLPAALQEMEIVLRSAFVQERGRIMRAGELSGYSDGPPLLNVPANISL